jgi:hypothetical protein
MLSEQKSNEGHGRSSNLAPNVKKVPSMPTIADDLGVLFGTFIYFHHLFFLCSIFFCVL